jgi:carboxyl-terminal processing protease
MNRLNHSIMAVLFGLLLGGCAESWISSVDAGFRYNTKNNRTMVFDVPPGTMSEAAGLKPGDIVLAVDGEDITNVSKNGVMAALKGPIGTMAILTIKRGSRIIDIRIERRR